MEVTYLYYPKEKIFSILPSELTKRGYHITEKLDDSFTLKICKKRFFSKSRCIHIQLGEEKNNTTRVEINDPGRPAKSKFEDLILEEIFRIF
jgi:hypothetical protein